MKTATIVVAISILLAAPGLAADKPQQAKEPGPNFEQRKSETLKRIDERIARNQEEKTCVQAAKDPVALKACRDKFVADIRSQRQKKQ